MVPYPLGNIISHYRRPSRFLDHWDLLLDPDRVLEPIRHSRHLEKYLKPWRTSLFKSGAGASVEIDKDKFQVNIDVQQFSPEEITVKLTGENTLTVEGKHEEKEDEHGFISRHFVRRYTVPKDCDVSRLKSKLSTDGILTITAPKNDANSIEYREIPIQQTGQPARQIEENKDHETMN